jgi:hypothetical protein
MTSSGEHPHPRYSSSSTSTAHGRGNPGLNHFTVANSHILFGKHRVESAPSSTSSYLAGNKIQINEKTLTIAKTVKQERISPPNAADTKQEFKLSLSSMAGGIVGPVFNYAIGQHTSTTAQLTIKTSGMEKTRSAPNSLSPTSSYSKGNTPAGVGEQETAEGEEEREL